MSCKVEVRRRPFDLFFETSDVYQYPSKKRSNTEKKSFEPRILVPSLDMIEKSTFIEFIFDPPGLAKEIYTSRLKMSCF